MHATHLSVPLHRPTCTHTALARRVTTAAAPPLSVTTLSSSRQQRSAAEYTSRSRASSRPPTGCWEGMGKPRPGGLSLGGLEAPAQTAAAAAAVVCQRAARASHPSALRVSNSPSSPDALHSWAACSKSSAHAVCRAREAQRPSASDHPTWEVLWATGWLARPQGVLGAPPSASSHSLFACQSLIIVAYCRRSADHARSGEMD